MNQKPRGRTSSSEQIIRDIKRKTRKRYSAEEKIRIVLDGLRGKVTQDGRGIEIKTNEDGSIEFDTIEGDMYLLSVL